MTDSHRIARTTLLGGILSGFLTIGCVHTDQAQSSRDESPRKGGAFSITLHCAPEDQIDESFESGFEPYPASHDFVEVATVDPVGAPDIGPVPDAANAQTTDMSCNTLLENVREASKLLTLQARYERSKPL